LHPSYTVFEKTPKRLREPAPRRRRYRMGSPNRSFFMDKDRISGSANQAKGAAKEAAGKITGDAKLKAEGAADKAKGNVQNAGGGARRVIRRASRHEARAALANGRPLAGPA